MDNLSSFKPLLKSLAKSKFRSSFRLSEKDYRYLVDKGQETIERHARDFILSRLAPAKPAKDGKQTPMKNHPVFTAQHATATCCRGCLKKWHGIQSGKKLSEEEIDYVIEAIMFWLAQQQNLHLQ